MIESRFSSALKGKLAERRAAILESLGAGLVHGFPDYMLMVGQLRGLDEAAKLADDTSYELSGER